MRLLFLLLLNNGLASCLTGAGSGGGGYDGLAGQLIMLLQVLIAWPGCSYHWDIILIAIKYLFLVLRI